LAIVGATGLVGTTMLQVLQQRKLPVDNLLLFATERSAGKLLKYNNTEIAVQALNANSFDDGINIALFSAGAATSKEFAPIAAKKGCVVVDNSSAWRMDTTVPLVVPEVNPNDVQNHSGIIANPNCSTIQAVVVLNPLHKVYNIKRVVYTTFQAVSGAGNGGLNDLQQTSQKNPPQHFPHAIANNCIPQIDSFDESGYTFEELKMINETRKILHEPQLKITATTVRVPITFGHSVSVNLTFENPFEVAEVRSILQDAPGVIVQDDPANNIYPMPITAAGTDSVYVGRIRRDFSEENSLNLWIVADNIRKGAATNAVQIAELIQN